MEIDNHPASRLVSVLLVGAKEISAFELQEVPFATTLTNAGNRKPRQKRMEHEHSGVCSLQALSSFSHSIVTRDAFGART